MHRLTIYRFGDRSKNNLEGVDARLIQVLNRAIKLINFTVICGYRSKQAQDAAFAAGTSKKRWPNSKHNVYPSEAVDFVPYPFKHYPKRDTPSYLKEVSQFYRIGAVISTVGAMMNIPIRYGGDWDMDGAIEDQTYDDIGHVELSLPAMP